MPYASFSPNASPEISHTFIHTDSSLAPNKKENKLEGVGNETNVNANKLIHNKENSKIEIFKLYQVPVQEKDEFNTEEESTSTEKQYFIAESNSVEQVGEELHEDNEEVWNLQQQQDELLEMMKQTAEERDACREELELLRDHCAALEDERSQLHCKVVKKSLCHTFN